MAHIELENATLTFRITHNGPVRFRDWVSERLFPERENAIVHVHALQGIDLSLRNGDRIGLIGHNGAGKTTLLKVIGDIYPLNSGRRTVDGRVSALFDVAVGFESDATGWENVAYRGYLQGESRSGVKRRLDDVVEFCDLGRYMDLPVRYYSDGMRVRLAFAIATAIEPEILLIDEAFNAGDADFRRRAKERLDGLVSKARIVLAAGHEHELLAGMCDRMIWLDKGHIREFGPTRDVLAAYRNSTEAQCPGAVAA